MAKSESTKGSNLVLHPFGPLYDENSRVLILGSFPSVKSREQQFFYGHPKNRFWPLLAALTGSGIPQNIEEKKQLALKNGIALWDVIASCEIVGSSDSSIRNAKPNDITPILENSNENHAYTIENTKDKTPEKYVKISFSVNGSNDSSVIARELYFSCTTSNYGSPYNKVRFFNYNQMDSILGMSNQLNLITRPELRLPPRSSFKFTNVEVILTAHTDDDFLFNGIIGAEGAAPRDFRIYINKNTLRSFVAKILRGEGDEQLWLNEFFSDFLRSDF